jgi:glycosyltransferase involved in cell wall biosynthesis
VFELVRPARPDGPASILRDSFQERVAVLSHAAVRVAYFYENPDNSTFRYRVGNMIAAINGSSGDSGLAAAYFTSGEIDQLAAVADDIDVLVICRARISHQLARLVARMRACGARILYDVDDLVFEPDLAPLIMDTLAVDRDSEEVVNYWFSYCSRIGAALRLCDAALVTNEALGHELASASGLSYAVLPNFLNSDQLAASEQIWAQKVASGFRTQGWHLGYFSGSPSHNRDFGTVATALARLLDADPKMGVRLVGFLDPGPALLRFGSRVERINLAGTVELQWLIGEANVCLAPLQDNVFTSCKSDLKWFEAAVAGTVTVASPAGGVGRRIKDRVNGRIARTYEWFETLSELALDPSAYRRLSEEARSEALAECTPESQLPQILEVLGAAASRTRRARNAGRPPLPGDGGAGPQGGPGSSE